MRSKKNNFKLTMISIVMPAFKQEKTIKKDIKNISSTLIRENYKFEIIVVIDGLVDKTYVNALKVRSPYVKVIGYKENLGKGSAVRFGMMHAKGDVIGFVDAGMDIHPAGLKMLLNHMEWYNADIIVGSKLHPVSKVNYPRYRTILSWGYRQLTKTLFGFKVRDTQVGLKFFKRKVVRDVLPRLLVKRYAFDIEILAVAYALGYRRIYEAPVEINFNYSSIISKNLHKTVINMLIDTFAVFYRLKILKWYTSKNKKNRNIFLRKSLLALKK